MQRVPAALDDHVSVDGHAKQREIADQDEQQLLEIYDRMYSERHDSYTNTLLFLTRSGRFPHSLWALVRFWLRQSR